MDFSRTRWTTFKAVVFTLHVSCISFYIFTPYKSIAVACLCYWASIQLEEHIWAISQNVDLFIYLFIFVAPSAINQMLLQMSRNRVQSMADQLTKEVVKIFLVCHLDSTLTVLVLAVFLSWTLAISNSDGAIDVLSFSLKSLWLGPGIKAEQNIIAQTDIKQFNGRVGKVI